MSFRTIAFGTALVLASPAFCQETSLEAELLDLNSQIADAEEMASRFDGGLILGLVLARREALLLARTLIENRINADAGAGTIEVIVPAVEPDEERAAHILEEMVLVQQRIVEAEQEAEIGGGLIRALTLSRAETERLTMAQLQMGYIQARYGIAFPNLQSQASQPISTTTTTAIPGPNVSEDEILIVEWADTRFPEIDYSLAPFEQAHRKGERISGWWVIEDSLAPVDDSPQVTAVNFSLYEPGIFSDQKLLVARCVEGETAIIFLQDDYLRNDYRRNSFEMTLRIDDAPPLQSRWSALTNNMGAGLFKADAEEFLRSIYDANKLFIRVMDADGQSHDGLFELTGAPDVFDDVSAACGWTTLSLSVDDYRAIQSLLNAGGFETGTPDGQWGPASQAAMRAYQAEVGLPVTGSPDRATLEFMGLN